MKKKFSCYNRYFEIRNVSFLYNMASDGILMLTPDTYDLLMKYKENPEKLSEVHPDLYERLSNNGMIVPAETTESESVIQKWKEEDASPESAKITINPTMGCNLRCWYCYENHSENTNISAQTVEAIKNWITKKTESPRLKVFTLDFFGGEPFLKFKECIRPLVEFTNEICKRKEIRFQLSFTTNGVLVDTEVLKFFQSLQYPSISFQITLDGSRPYHDMTRVTAQSTSTYKQIIDNIKEIITAGFFVFVRFNYTDKNYASFVDVIQDFKKFAEPYKSRLQFSFHKVWQIASSEQMEENIQQSRAWFEQEGFQVSQPVKYGKERCYADSERNIVVNYDGNLFKCTAREFNPLFREGFLKPDGTVEWNQRYKERMQIRYGNAVCHACTIFPICHGGCSQDKLEHGAQESCIRRYNEREKEEIVENRFMMLLKNASVKKQGKSL